MLFSIIIPMYNIENYIERCIKSIVKQDISDTEVLIINDGSCDNSLEIANKLAKDYDNVFVFSKENGGVSSARNHGIKKARGKYLLFVDGDDQIMEWTLSSLRKIIQDDSNIDCVIGNRRNYIEDKNEIEDIEFTIDKEYIDNKSGKEVLDYLYNKTNIVMYEVWKYCVRRDVVIDNSIFFTEGLQMGEDFEWTSRILVYSKCCRYLDGNHYIYTKNRNDSLMNKVSVKKQIDLLTVQKNLFELAIKTYCQALKYAVSRSFALVLIPEVDLSMPEAKDKLLPLIRSSRYLIKETVDKRVKLVDLLWKIIGLKNTIRLLNIYRNKNPYE